MTRRKHSPVHDFWHPRIEGQIRHTIGQHPRWFRFNQKSSDERDCINSLAKRIVGEIVAAYRSGDKTDSNDANCKNQGNVANAVTVSRQGGAPETNGRRPLKSHLVQCRQGVARKKLPNPLPCGLHSEQGR